MTNIDRDLQAEAVAPSLDAARLWQVIEVGRTVLTELDEAQVLDRVLETAQRLTGARYAALGILDPERRELERFLTRGLDAQARKAIGELPRGRGVLGALIGEPRPLRLNEIGEHPRSYGFPAGHPPMHSFLGAPILIRGDAWGNLYLAEKAGGEFDQSDEDALVLLASWAAIAVEHARLHGAARARSAELEHAVRSLRATQEIAVALGGETDLERVLELVVKRGRALVQARTVLIMLREQTELVVVASAGHARGALGRRVPIGDSTSGEVLEHGRSERIGDVAARLRIAPVELGVSDASSALLVPMSYHGRGVGVLAAFDREGSDQAFSAEDEQALKAFAASAAMAVTSARTIAAERLHATLAAAEEERRRWARELHDQTLQSLGGLRLQLAAALRRGDLVAWEHVGQAAIEQLADEIADIRAIITDLRPPALDEIGLAAAVESLASYHERASGLSVHSEVALPDGLVAAELETTVYRVVQEALTNVVKHAQAQGARVKVWVVEGWVALEVQDDGTGFDTEQPAAGFGLTGIRERVALASGSVAIDSGDDGTVVRARIPTAGASIGSLPTSAVDGAPAGVRAVP